MKKKKKKEKKPFSSFFFLSPLALCGFAFPVLGAIVHQNYQAVFKGSTIITMTSKLNVSNENFTKSVHHHHSTQLLTH